MNEPNASSAALVVSGMSLRGEILGHVEQVVVDEDLHRPAMFVITLTDPKREVLAKSGLTPGVTVDISITGRGADDDRPLLSGNVVSLECDYDQLGARVVARGYAASHRLHRGRRTRVFRDVTDSDIVKQIAQEAGLEVGDIEPTSEVHAHVSQANVTDWEFLADRARGAGIDLTIVDGKLRFGKRSASTGAPSEAGRDPRHLKFGVNLETFHGRVSAAEQVGQVEVRGWDEDRKEPVVATVGGGTMAADLDKASPTELAGYFGAPDLISVTTPVRSEREAEDTAKALAERVGSAFAEAEGTASGSTLLRAGVAVRVSGVNEHFNGAYVLTRVRHVINNRGYRTHFTVSGRQDRSLLGLVAANGNGSAGSHGDGLAGDRAPGFVRGVVSDNKDPDQLGRVKVSFPWLDADYSSAWAPVMQLGAGPDRGTLFLPAVGDEVLVGFERGLVDRPVVVGGLFNKLDKPPAHENYLKDGAVVGRGIWSANGHEITFHDAGDLEGIVIVARDDSKAAAVSVGLNGKDSKLVVISRGAVEVRADKEILLKGSKIAIEADGDLVLKGATIKLN